MLFHHHPDGKIIIKMEDFVYRDTVANFILDLQADYSFIGKERYYEPGVRHFVDRKPMPIPWEEGDEFIAQIVFLLKAKESRDAIIPPLTDDQRELARVLQEPIDAAEAIVVATRPAQQHKQFMTMTRRQFSTWYAKNGPEEAFWIVIFVLRYLIACKNRSKAWIGRHLD